MALYHHLDLIFKNMSQQDINILKDLKQDAQNEAKRQSERFTVKDRNTVIDMKEYKQLSDTKPVDQQQIFKQNPSNISNIFKRKSESVMTNLFQPNLKSVNLFNLINTQQNPTNIFNLNSKPLINHQSSEDSLSESVNSSRKSISNKDNQLIIPKYEYDYKTDMKTIAKFQLKKFRNGTNPTKDSVTVVLLQREGEINMIYLIIQTLATKVILYESILIKQICKFENFMGKDDNVKFNVIKQKRKTSQQVLQNQQLIKQTLKMQFQSVESLKEFQDTINQTFKALQ